MPKPTTEQKAKRQLAKMLQSLTTGSILHLLGDVLADQTEESTSERSQQVQIVQNALIVVGAGIDVLLPS